MRLASVIEFVYISRMKYFLLLFLLPIIAFGQEVEQKFVYDQKGLTPQYVVVDITGKTKDELFKNTINWIKENYVDPEKVIKTTIENEKIRFRAFKDNLICVNSLGTIVCNGAYYTIEIAFKDSKYKFTPIVLEQISYATSYDGNISFTDGSRCYNKKGKLKKYWESVPSTTEGLFNGLNSELSEYLLQTNTKTDDDW